MLGGQVSSIEYRCGSRETLAGLVVILVSERAQPWAALNYPAPEVSSANFVQTLRVNPVKVAGSRIARAILVLTQPETPHLAYLYIHLLYMPQT